jgi:hypothetical protein
VNRRVAGIAASALLAVAAYGCGGSSGPSVSSGVRRDVHPAGNDKVGTSTGTRTVEYRGVAFDVPADWKVFDLERDPSTCVRFDLHAVYLGTPGADMECPAQVMGHTDALVVQPAEAAAQSASAAAVTTQEVNGLAVAVADNTATEGEIGATANGVTLTFEIGDSSTTAQTILQTVRAVGP